MSRISSSEAGEVNGWWEKVIVPSSCSSNSGKSITHRKARSSWAVGRRRSLRSVPRTSTASSPSVGSHQQDITGPAHPGRLEFRSVSASARNFATGERSDPSCLDDHPHQTLGSELLGPLGERVGAAPGPILRPTLMPRIGPAAGEGVVEDTESRSRRKCQTGRRSRRQTSGLACPCRTGPCSPAT